MNDVKLEKEEYKELDQLRKIPELSSLLKMRNIMQQSLNRRKVEDNKLPNLSSDTAEASVLL